MCIEIFSSHNQLFDTLVKIKTVLSESENFTDFTVLILINIFSMGAMTWYFYHLKKYCQVILYEKSWN